MTLKLNLVGNPNNRLQGYLPMVTYNVHQKPAISGGFPRPGLISGAQPSYSIRVRYMHGWGCLAATALAVEASMIHNFAWHLRWTWRDRSLGLPARGIAARLLRFQLSNGAVALTVNLISMPLLTGAAGLSYPLAGALASLTGGLVNFALSGLWVFTRRATAARDRPRFCRCGVVTS